MSIRAIIMAGGEGSRLRPLTCDLPKPMMPILGWPVMRYGLQLLRRHGIVDVGATVQYLPQKIIAAFGDGARDGVHLRYFHEKEPMGTAGSVGMARDQLKDSFFVLSGDGLTDCDLHSALQFHKKRGAAATLVLKRVAHPLAYGVVVTDGDGRVRRFIEKPGWDEVCSDTVNTGIYILEPEVLDWIPQDRPYDFGRELFPLMLEKNLPLYGYVMNGYWCDIGDQGAYVQAQVDFLAGKVLLEADAKPNARGIWQAGEARIHEDARVEGPCYLGENVVIGPKAQLLGGSVLGPGVILGEGVSIKRSVLWPNSRVGRGATLRGVVLGDGVQVGEGACAYEDAALGDGAILGDRARLDPGVKIWPCKRVDPGMRVASNLIWGDLKRPQADERGMEPNSPETACILAAAFAKVSNAREIALMRGEGVYAQALAAAALSGLMGQGVEVLDMGTGSLPMLRRLQRMLGIPAGLFIRDDRMLPAMAGGVWPSRTLLRSWETLAQRQDFQRAFSKAPSMPKTLQDGSLFYAGALASSCDGESIRALQPHIAVFVGNPAQEQLARRIFESIGLGNVRISQDSPRVEAWETGFLLSDDGMQVQALDSQGTPDDEQQLLLRCQALLELGEKQLIVPMHAPFTLEQLAGQHKARVKRVRASAESWMNALADAKLLTQLDIFFDGMAAMLAMISLLARRRISLRDLLNQQPKVYRVWETIPCTNPDKGRVLRELAAVERFPDMTDGLRVDHGDGFAMLITGTGQPDIRIFGEARDAEFAKELCEKYTGRVKAVLEGKE